MDHADRLLSPDERMRLTEMKLAARELMLEQWAELYGLEPDDLGWSPIESYHLGAPRIVDLEALEHRARRLDVSVELAVSHCELISIGLRNGWLTCQWIEQAAEDGGPELVLFFNAAGDVPAEYAVHLKPFSGPRHYGSVE